MRHLFLIAALVGAAPAVAGLAEGGERVRMADVFVYPAEMERALLPLRQLARDTVRDGRCPGLKPTADGTLFEYVVDARFGVQNRRTGIQPVTDVRLADGSGCAALDAAVRDRLMASVNKFAEPWNLQVGWVKLPRVRVTTGD